MEKYIQPTKTEEKSVVEMATENKEQKTLPERVSPNEALNREKEAARVEKLRGQIKTAATERSTPEIIEKTNSTNERKSEGLEKFMRDNFTESEITDLKTNPSPETLKAEITKKLKENYTQILNNAYSETKTVALLASSFIVFGTVTPALPTISLAVATGVVIFAIVKGSQVFYQTHVAKDKIKSFSKITK